jgi:hypothetical protein
VLRQCHTREALERRCDHIASHLLRWAGRPVFIDVAMLNRTCPQAIEVMVARAGQADIRPVVVVSPKMMFPRENEDKGVYYARRAREALTAAKPFPPPW